MVVNWIGSIACLTSKNPTEPLWALFVFNSLLILLELFCITYNQYKKYKSVA